MIEFSQQSLIDFFAQYAYAPGTVYSFIILFMFLSSFGFPIPEEITLISAGLVAHMASNPDIFPPPYEGASGVNTITLCIVCFAAVLGSDLVIYGIGRFFGDQMMKSKFFQRQVNGSVFIKINNWFNQYGKFACGIFRFTPGLRFPGHLSCGIMKIPFKTFLMVDGTAALISVPTQVYIASIYGDVILSKLKEFKLVFLGIIILVVCIWLVKKGIKIKEDRRV